MILPMVFVLLLCNSHSLYYFDVILANFCSSDVTMQSVQHADPSGALSVIVTLAWTPSWQRENLQSGKDSFTTATSIASCATTCPGHMRLSDSERQQRPSSLPKISGRCRCTCGWLKRPIECLNVFSTGLAGTASGWADAWYFALGGCSN